MIGLGQIIVDIKSDSLHLREDSNQNSKVVVKIPNKARLCYLGVCSEDWIMVEYFDESPPKVVEGGSYTGTDYLGWVHKDFIQVPDWFEKWIAKDFINKPNFE